MIENETFQFVTLFPVESVTPSGKYVADVKLKQLSAPSPASRMGYGGLLVSKRAHEEMGNEKYARNPIGNGPFGLESWTSNAEVVLKKNPSYWQQGVLALDQPRLPDHPGRTRVRLRRWRG